MHNNEYCIGYNFLEASESFREDRLEPVTLCTHATADMMETLEKKPSNWDGPISIGLFIDFHSAHALEYLYDVRRCDKEFREKVSLHFAFRLMPFQNACPTLKLPTSHLTCDEFLKQRSTLRKTISAPFQLHPYALMRNVARYGAKSEIHFLADGDMLMSDGFMRKVKPIANRMIDGKQKKLLVVRRFESDLNVVPPRNHTQLKELVEKEQVFEFHHKFFFMGHQIPNITHWFNVSDTSYQVSAWQIPYSNEAWEPQIILHRKDLYNTDYFPSRMRDMTSVIYSSCRANYTFHLLSHVFNVHEGVKTADSVLSKAVLAHQAKFARDRAYKRFVKEMDELYPSTLERCGKFNM
ncbi:unnamed protein product [Caenorhabditis sp. 36 PRJEB53466]|nr:unnamed protein product [Caenorhabditis sp. 36 PRJEB53466]